MLTKYNIYSYWSIEKKIIYLLIRVLEWTQLGSFQQILWIFCYQYHFSNLQNKEYQCIQCIQNTIFYSYMQNLACNMKITCFHKIVILNIMYRTWNIYKFTFYMKLMTVSCSMSNFLPIVIIFRQIIVSKFYFT